MADLDNLQATKNKLCSLREKKQHDITHAELEITISKTEISLARARIADYKKELKRITLQYCHAYQDVIDAEQANLDAI